MENRQPHELGLDFVPQDYEAWKAQATALMQKLYGRTTADSTEQVQQMFSLYNQAFTPRYSSWSCSSCVQSVHGRMSFWYRKQVMECAAAEVAQKAEAAKAEDKPKRKR